MDYITQNWKATLETVPTKSELSLHSLWDLLYTSSGSLRTAGTVTGVKLAHDIICYSTLEYTGSDIYHDGTADIKAGNNSYNAESLYFLFGIDASIAQYDSRVKNKTESNGNTLDFQSSDDAVYTAIANKNGGQISYNLFNKGIITYHDKKSVLKPDSDASFLKKCVYISDNEEDYSTIFLTSSTRLYYAPLVEPYDSTSTIKSSIDIYLTNVDTAFRGTLTTTPEYSAYNRLCLNYKSKWTSLLVLKALRSQFEFEKDTFNSTTGWMTPGLQWMSKNNNDLHARSISSDALSEFVFKTLPAAVNGKTDSASLLQDPNSTWAQLLKHTFIWIKAPFFGDYIQPDVFAQNLTPESDVKHKNLILSDTSDFNRYDEYTSISTNPDTSTLPYVPIASPTVDLLTKKLAGLGVSDLSSLTENDIKTVIDAGDEDDSVIGGIAMASETRDGSNNIVQPGYWDPESKRDADEYSFANNHNKFHLPTIIPSTGNIFTNGRVISPTIDELWIYIKQLTSGRNSDIYTDNNVTYSRIKDLTALDEAIPYGTSGEEQESVGSNVYKINLIEGTSPSSLDRNNNKDTRLTVVPTTEYSFTYDSKTVYGDIVGLDVSVDKESNQTIKVSKYVNSNDSIVYGIYSSLKHLSDNITTFDYTDKDDDGHKEREIYNFTAWNTINNDDTDVTKDGDIVIDKSLWQPRSAPYSLRELEALIKGNKFNLITLARFIKENFGVTGRLGKVTTTGEILSWLSLDENNKTIQKSLTVTDDNIARGSLYQFHKDYNFNVAKPNTWFNQEGEGTYESGTGAVFDGTRFSESTDLNYGDADSINRNQAKYSSSDVYMAADGTWRYVFDHVRLPIVKVDY